MRRPTLPRLLPGVLALLLAAPAPAAPDLMDLVTARPLVAEDDRVMGGVSRSRPRLHDGRIVFTGRLSRDQGGGFASAEAEFPRLGLALVGTAGVALRVRGDGRVYQLRFRQRGGGDSLWYKAFFRAPPGDPSDVRLEWSEFRASFHGELQPDAPPLRPGDIRGLALHTSDGPEGRFFLEVLDLRAASQR